MDRPLKRRRERAATAVTKRVVSANRYPGLSYELQRRVAWLCVVLFVPNLATIATLSRRVGLQPAVGYGIAAIDTDAINTVVHTRECDVDVPHFRGMSIHDGKIYVG